MIAGVPSSLLQAHFPVLHLAHVPAGHCRLLHHDVPHQPRVSLGQPGLPPPPPPCPSLPLTQQHLGLHQPGSYLSSGKPCPPVVPLWGGKLVFPWQLSCVLGKPVLRTDIPRGWFSETKRVPHLFPSLHPPGAEVPADAGCAEGPRQVLAPADAADGAEPPRQRPPHRLCQ